MTETAAYLDDPNIFPCRWSIASLERSRHEATPVTYGETGVGRDTVKSSSVNHLIY